MIRKNGQKRSRSPFASHPSQTGTWSENGQKRRRSPCKPMDLQQKAAKMRQVSGQNCLISSRWCRLVTDAAEPVRPSDTISLVNRVLDFIQ